jgi:hypothetical protein
MINSSWHSFCPEKFIYKRKQIMPDFPVKSEVETIVIKPGPARRVDPGPGRPGGWTGPGLIKDRVLQQPGQTRVTRANPDETRFSFLFFFSNVRFETH